MPVRQNEPDSELIHQAKRGDAEVYGILYERYAGSIYKYLYLHLGDREDAEDLTVEVFLRAWQAIPAYDERGLPFRAYLFKIARHLMIDFYRQKKYFGNLDENLKDTVVVDLEESAVADASHASLKRFLNAIHDDYRHVLILRFFAGLSLAEISKVMQRSENAVRVLQHRALRAIRELLLLGENHDGH